MISTIHYQACPICGSSNIRFSISAKDHTVSGSTFEIWQCDDCKARFTQNVPVENEIGAYYSADSYISHTNTSKGLINRLYHVVRSITLKNKRKLVKSVTELETGRLLDVGAGIGAFSHTMKSAGWQVTALEPDSTAIAKAKELFGLTLMPSENLFRLEEEFFDVITLWHVLEHVHRLHEYMDRFQRILKKNAILVVAVPNHQSLDAEKYGSSWAAYDVPRHLYHFSPESISSLAARHGFKVEKKLPMWFDSFYVSMLSEQYKTGKGNLVSGAFTGLRSNLRAMGQKDQASSVIYVLRKN